MGRQAFSFPFIGSIHVHICAQKHKHTKGYSFTKRIWCRQMVQRHWLFICKLPEALELQVRDSIPGICMLFCFLRQGRSVAQAGMENKLAFASVDGDRNTAQGRDFSPRPTARLSNSVRPGWPGTLYMGQTGLKLTLVLLPQPPEYEN